MSPPSQIVYLEFLMASEEKENMPKKISRAFFRFVAKVSFNGECLAIINA